MFENWFRKPSVRVLQTEHAPELSEAQGGVEERIYRGDLAASDKGGFDATPLTAQAAVEQRTGDSVYALPNSSNHDWQGERAELVSVTPGAVVEDTTPEQQVPLSNIKRR
jgi:hypothetical protein